MKTAEVQLAFDDGEVLPIWPYLVGDAAFPLGVHMIKAIDAPPAAGSAEKQFNTRILLARRVIERCFGRLKGRWVLCKRNAFWNNVRFTTAAIEACCGLHNFLEERDVGLPAGVEDIAADHVGELILEPLEPEGQSGSDKRGALVQWVTEHN